MAVVRRLFAALENAENVANRRDVAFPNQTAAHLGDFAFEDAFILCFAIKFEGCSAGFVELIFERNVLEEVLLEIVLCGFSGRVVSAHGDYESVVKTLRHAVRPTCLGRFVVARCCVVSVDAKGEVDSRDVVRKPVVERLLKE